MADTKEVQDPPLMPWEHSPEVTPEAAMDGFAGELENELYGSPEGTPRKPKPKPKVVETEDEVEDDGDEPGEEIEEGEEPDEVDDPESQDEDEQDKVEWEFAEGEFEQVVRAKPHVVKIDGEDVELTYDDLVSGHLRQADYTRKTQQLAEERRAEKTVVSQVRERLVEKLKTVEQVLAEASPVRSAEYWDNLRAKDPAKYAAEFADAQRAEQQKAAVRKKREEEEQELHAEQQDQFSEYAAHEYTALTKQMGWKNDTEARSALDELGDFASKEFGFTREQLAQVVDHRLLLMLHYAKQHIDQKTAGSEKIRKKLKKTKTLQPGGRTTETRQPTRKGGRRVNKRQVSALRKDLSQTGSQRSAVSLFEQLIGDDD